MNKTSARQLPWLLLFGRTLLFISLQSLFAIGCIANGVTRPWAAGAAWWPLGVTLVNLFCLAIMVFAVRHERSSYWSFFRIERAHINPDLLMVAVVLLLAAPVSYLPNVLLANALFGDAQVALTLLVRPLPLWAAYIAVALFPITQGLVELPLYFLYVMPRLRQQGVPDGVALALSVLMLGFQHLAIPFLFDIRFITWRGLMFMPFALLVGIVLWWRPRLL
ncbi:MAG: hypothetical protein KDE19_07465, partial [Caldilineaceae bacterium]|nr:hypothetical protein [Caldilineaceae bacterium]